MGQKKKVFEALSNDHKPQFLWDRTFSEHFFRRKRFRKSSWSEKLKKMKEEAIIKNLIRKIGARDSKGCMLVVSGLRDKTLPYTLCCTFEVAGFPNDCLMLYGVVCMCVHFILDVRFADVPAGVTQDSSTLLLRCLPKFFSREGFSRSFPSSTVKSNSVF